MLPHLLTSEMVARFATTIQHHLEKHGRRYRTLMEGKTRGGWYIPDFPMDAELAPMLDELLVNARLHEALERLHGTRAYRLLQRSEIYVDKGVGWHPDALYAGHALYNNEIDIIKRECAQESSADKLKSRDCMIGVPAQKPFWQPTLKNDSQSITTVAIYLQDHRQDELGLSVKPGSHISAKKSQASKAATEDNLDVKLHYPPGSAVIFDARTLHKGAALRQANHEGLLHRPHRYTISLTFGALNAISAAFDRGFAMRNRLYRPWDTNARMCTRSGLTPALQAMLRPKRDVSMTPSAPTLPPGRCSPASAGDMGLDCASTGRLSAATVMRIRSPRMRTPAGVVVSRLHRWLCQQQPLGQCSSWAPRAALVVTWRVRTHQLARASM